MSTTELRLIDSKVFAEMTAEERRGVLRSCLALSAKSIVRAALIYAVMVEQGDDVTFFSPVLRGVLRRIAAQKMLPEIYIRYGGTLRQRIAALPLLEQKRFVEGGTVPLVVRRGDRTEILKVKPDNLTLLQVKQVFAADHIRDEAEQAAWIEDLDLRSRVEKKFAEIEVLPRKGGIRVAGVFLSRKELFHLLSELG